MSTALPAVAHSGMVVPCCVRRRQSCARPCRARPQTVVVCPPVPCHVRRRWSRARPCRWDARRVPGRAAHGGRACSTPPAQSGSPEPALPTPGASHAPYTVPGSALASRSHAPCQPPSRAEQAGKTRLARASICTMLVIYSTLETGETDRVVYGSRQVCALVLAHTGAEKPYTTGTCRALGAVSLGANLLAEGLLTRRS